MLIPNSPGRFVEHQDFTHEAAQVQPMRLHHFLDEAVSGNLIEKFVKLDDRVDQFGEVIGKRVEFCPSLWGSKDWPSAAYSQKTGLVYVRANEKFCGGFTGEKVPLKPGELWLGTKPEDIGLKVRPGADHYGELQACAVPLKKNAAEFVSAAFLFACLPWRPTAQV